MNGIEVKLDTEVVQRELVQAILGASLGEKIEAAVNNVLKDKFGGRGTVIDQAVAAEIHEQVRIRCRELIREPGEVRDLIETKLREALTPEAIEQITKKFTTNLGMITEEDIPLR